MRVLKSDLKKAMVKLLPESSDDLWAILAVVSKGDRIEAKTLRKVKPFEESKAERRAFWLAIELERAKVEGGALRLFGKIIEGPEEVPRGSGHTISIQPGDALTIIKKEWFEWQIEKLSQPRQPRILIVVLDREEAIMATLQLRGYQVLARLRGAVAKKGQEKALTEDFFSKLAKEVEDSFSKLKAEHIIIASPAFWKEEFFEKLSPELRKKSTLATCSGVDEQALNELLKRPELKSALAEAQSKRELELLEKVLLEIKKGGKAAYGLASVKLAAEQGSVEELIVSEEVLEESREVVESLMALVEKAKGRVHVFSKESDAGKRLKGIGGIAALLRWRIEFLH